MTVCDGNIQMQAYKNNNVNSPGEICHLSVMEKYCQYVQLRKEKEWRDKVRKDEDKKDNDKYLNVREIEAKARDNKQVGK